MQRPQVLLPLELTLQAGILKGVKLDESKEGVANLKGSWTNRPLVQDMSDIFAFRRANGQGMSGFMGWLSLDVSLFLLKAVHTV